MGERDKPMDFNLNENQRLYVETVRRFVKSEILPNILELEKKHEFPGGIIRKAWELGLLNLFPSWKTWSSFSRSCRGRG